MRRRRGLRLHAGDEVGLYGDLHPGLDPVEAAQRLEHRREGKAAPRQKPQQRLPADIEPQRQKQRQQHPDRIKDAQKPPLHIAARLAHLRHGVKSVEQTQHPLRRRPERQHGAGRYDRRGARGVERAHEKFQRPQRPIRCKLLAEREQMIERERRVGQQGQKQAHHWKHRQQQEKRRVARVNGDLHGRNACKQLFDPPRQRPDPFSKLHTQPSYARKFSTKNSPSHDFSPKPEILPPGASKNAGGFVESREIFLFSNPGRYGSIVLGGKML